VADAAGLDAGPPSWWEPQFTPPISRPTAQQEAADADQRADAAEQDAAAAQQQAAAAGALPEGTVVSTLPDGCTSKAVGGVEYYQCGANTYRSAFQGNNLVYVTTAPP
jgi:hypothetical protein